jgi:hypothetical protein
MNLDSRRNAEGCDIHKLTGPIRFAAHCTYHYFDDADFLPSLVEPALLQKFQEERNSPDEVPVRGSLQASVLDYTQWADS